MVPVFANSCSKLRIRIDIDTILVSNKNLAGRLRHPSSAAHSSTLLTHHYSGKKTYYLKPADRAAVKKHKETRLRPLSDKTSADGFRHKLGASRVPDSHHLAYVARACGCDSDLVNKKFQATQPRICATVSLKSALAAPRSLAQCLPTSAS